MTGRCTSRLAALTAGLLVLLAGAVEAQAVAGLRAAGTAGSGASSGVWSAVPTTSPDSPGTGPLTVVYGKRGRTTPSYLDVVNTGSLSLDRARYVLTASPYVDAVLEACTGTWDEAAGTCSGDVVVLASTAQPGELPMVPAQPGTSLRVRVRPVAPVTAQTELVVDVQVPAPAAP